MHNNDYKDKKKYLWLISTISPLLATLGVYIFKQTSNPLAIFLPLLYIYVAIPILDMIFSEDQSNPPESAVAALEKMRYYDWISYLMLPFHFYSLYYVTDFIVTTDLPLWMDTVLVITLGVFAGLAVNLGHELGHKKNAFDKHLAKLALASSAYGHFNIEHNAGHHRDVATPQDSASSKFGESIYKFALREIPGGLKRAWRIEKKRLARKGLSVWSIHNQIIHSYAITLIIYTLFSYFIGPMAIVVLLLHTPIAWWQLTSANYIEHYGLLRKKNIDGKYEKCSPQHSWNSNHVFSNLVLFHLQRHADHHANPARHFQSLRHFPEAPQLPTGYMGMFIIAYIPPLWRKIMDPKVLKLANNNFDHINHI